MKRIIKLTLMLLALLPVSALANSNKANDGYYNNNRTNTTVSNKNQYVGVSSIKLNKSTCVMPLGGTRQLTATILPSNASATSITWMSTNSGVATVNSNGLITAVTAGETNIVVMADNVRAICHVIVSPMQIESLMLSDLQQMNGTVSTSCELAMSVTDNLSTGELAWLTNGDPAKTGQATQDHFFVRGDYDDTGEMRTYDNTVSFKSGPEQTVWFYLDDDEIYENAAVQALTPIAYNEYGDLYHEITYNSFQMDIYLPQGIELVDNGYYENGYYYYYYEWVGGDRLPYSSNLVVGQKEGIKVIDGKNYTAYTVVVYNVYAYGSHLSAQSAGKYRRNGALKKDYTVFGLYVKNNNQGSVEGRIDDIILGNMIMNCRETAVAEWSSNESTFFYGTGGNNENQRFMQYNRVKTYGSMGIDDIILVDGISLDKTDAEMTVGNTMQLTASVSPSNATNKAIIWSTSNNSVATVNSNGLVTAVAPGTATIIATTTDGTNLSATCTVTVNPVIYATSISLDKISATITEGNTLQLAATVLPTNTTNKTVTWSTSNSNVATVNSNGLVTAVAPGTATIIATTTDGTNLSATCAVTVQPNVIYATSISLNKTSATLTEGNTLQLTATVLPSNATNKTVTWSTSNSSVATVNSNGLVTAIAPGSATITARTTDGTNLSATCNVTVQPNIIYATSITLNQTSATITEGEDLQLLATVLPSNTTNKTVSWSTSSSSIVTVDSNGLVTAVGRGSATITARTTDGTNLRATCTVTVTQNIVLATSISLDQTSAELNSGNTLQLMASVLPSNTTNKTVTWSTSNSNIATVNSNGLVTAIAPGSATITARTNDGTNLSATCAIMVKMLPNSNNVFSMPDMTVSQGEIVVIPVTMTNQDEITAFQTDIYLPDGFEIVKEDGDYVVELSNRRTNSHVIMANDAPGGFVRILSYSSSLKPFSGHDGVLFYISVKAPEQGDGVCPIELRDTRLTTTSGDELSIADAACNVTIEPYLTGDANNSGDVTITDVVVTARHILFYNPQPFIFVAADVNHDSQITVSDAVNIAYMVLNGTPMGVPARMPALSGNDLMSGTGLWTSGNSGTVSILLDNVADYTAFQFDIRMPDGMTARNFRLTDRAGSHTLGTAISDDGSTRVLCYSSSLQPITGNEGAVLTFDVTTAGSADGDITASCIELVTTTGQTVNLAPFAISMAPSSGVTGTVAAKAISRVDYYNLAGQRLDAPQSGVTIVVTTYDDGTRTVSKAFK